MGKRCKNIETIVIMLFYWCFSACHKYQRFSVALCDTPLESIWVTDSNYFDYVKYDSISYLVFEGKFKDTFAIRLNGDLILRRFLKSEKSLEVIPETVPIKINSPKNSLEVRLVSESKCFTVKKLKKFTYCYISRNKNLWFIEYSDFKREYR